MNHLEQQNVAGHLQSFLGPKALWGALGGNRSLALLKVTCPRDCLQHKQLPAERTWKRCKTWNVEGAKIRGKGVTHLPENATLGVPHRKGVSREPSKHPTGEATGLWELTADYSCAEVQK